MLWTDTSDINSLIVTLSLSPSMMLLGVRSRWMIRFSLCKYLKARQICGGFSMNTYFTSIHIFLVLFKCRAPHLYENVPDSLLGERLPFLFERAEMFSQRSSFYELHHDEELISWDKDKKRTVFNHLFLYGVKMYENTMKIWFLLWIMPQKKG